MAKTVTIVFVLLLSCCSKSQHTEDVEKNRTRMPELSEITVVNNKQHAQAEKSLTQLLKLKKITIAEIMAQELKDAAIMYEGYFERPTPDYGERSDLELLLILERANKRLPSVGERLADSSGRRKNIIPYIDVPYVTKNTMLKNELTEAGTEYEKKFRKKYPWWWICSNEEKLARLKLAFETGIPYHEYGGDRGEIDYRLGKAIAGYEMWFRKQPPKQDCSDEEWLARLERAINAESPFLTTEEEATLKAEYYKRFKRPITDLELSIMKISLAQVFHVDGPYPQTSVIRTATGAIALYQPSARFNDVVSINPGSIEIELSSGEWLDFINVLHKHIGGWENVSCNEPRGGSIVGEFWELKLFFANTETKKFRSYNDCPSGWNALVKFMDSMETKIKNNGVEKHPPKTSVGQKHVHAKGGTFNGWEKLKIAKGTISTSVSLIVGVKSDGTVVMAGGRFAVRLFSGLNMWNNIVAVSAGDEHVVGLKSDNTVIAIGPPENDDLSNVVSWKDIVAVSAGEKHTLGLRSNGTVASVGLNSDGQCDVTEWDNIVAISAGSYHTLGLRSNGMVVSAGVNSSGQCSVDDWKDIVAISAGRFHSVGLKSNGTVVTAGRDWDGMCSKTLPWNNIIAVAVGDLHTVGLRSDGTVLAVGDSAYGKCNVSGWKNIIAIAASKYLTLGLRSDGTAVLVGDVQRNAEAVSGWSGLDTAGVGGSR